MKTVFWILALLGSLCWPPVSTHGQQLRPGQLTINGVRWNLQFAETGNAPQSSATLTSQDGVSGHALFLFKEGHTFGTVYLPEKSFSVSVDSISTNITELPKHGTVDCLSEPIDPEDRPLEKGTFSVLWFRSEIVVDLIAFYTPAAKAASGGETAVRAKIELAVAEANQVFKDSGARVVIRLVHARELPYTETSSLATDLDRFSTAGDGFIDSVQILKSQYKADIASLFVASNDPVNAGIGYILTGSSKRAYNVVKIQFAVGHYIFAHELGHNFGCAHDRHSAPSSGAFSYSHGHRFQIGTETFRTVMAYAPGRRLPFFSTPLKTYRGYPLGTATEDNARTIRERALYISQIEIAPACIPSPPVFVRQPESLLVLPGTAISLGVQVTGRTPLAYQWFKNGSPIAAATNAVYSPGRAVTAFQGSYSLRVSNADGARTSSVATVTLLTSPVIARQPSAITVTASNSFQLQVLASSLVPVTYQWRKNGVLIPNTANRIFSVSSACITDAGVYSVLVSNEAGSVESSAASVEVLPPPAAPPSTPIETRFLQVHPLTGGQITLRFQTAPGRRYRLEGSANTSEWSLLHTAVAAEAINEYTDTQAPACRHRFYRILLID